MTVYISEGVFFSSETNSILVVQAVWISMLAKVLWGGGLVKMVFKKISFYFYLCILFGTSTSQLISLCVPLNPGRGRSCENAAYIFPSRVLPET
jgi:hypothetical protein